MPDDTLTMPAQRAYETWVRLTFLGASDGRSAWQLLEPATRALWEAIAQAARQGPEEDPE